MTVGNGDNPPVGPGTPPPKTTNSAGTASGGNTPIEQDETEGGNASIDAPRLTPQGRTSPEASGTDATAPSGTGVAKGQPDKAEG